MLGAMHADRLPSHFTIGQASRHSGVSAKAIRHYESLGLIPSVPRRGSYRLYQGEHIDAIRLIRKAQSLGFTLAELRQLGTNDCAPDWPRFVLALSHKREALAAEIARLQALDAELAELQTTLPGLIATEPDCVTLTTELARA
jgi:DNA-binding transcriptional MerR regulator